MGAIHQRALALTFDGAGNCTSAQVTGLVVRNSHGIINTICMDQFLRGDAGIVGLLPPHIPDALQSQLDSKVHRDDHMQHADTLSTVLK